MTAGPAAGLVSLGLGPGAILVLDGTEWTVERAEPQFGPVVLMAAGGERRRVTFRFLMRHPSCRESSRSAARTASGRGRQEASEGDLTPHQRELVALRVVHLLEVETGFRSGSALQPGPGEPKPCYDPATLIAGLPAQPGSGTIRPYIDWGDSKRLLASVWVWVWVQITHGEHIFAPSHPPQPQPTPTRRHDHPPHPHTMAAHQRPPTHRPLHRTPATPRRLCFADTLATTIDDREIHW